MKNRILKKYDYQTESNKFYTILEEIEFDKEKGISLNPFLDSKNIFDKEVVIIKDNDLKNIINFNIRNTEFGLFLEVYSSSHEDVFIVDKSFELSEILSLIEKLYNFSYETAIKYLKYKFGFKDIYLFY